MNKKFSDRRAINRLTCSTLLEYNLFIYVNIIKDSLLVIIALRLSNIVRVNLHAL